MSVKSNDRVECGRLVCAVCVILTHAVPAQIIATIEEKVVRWATLGVFCDGSVQCWDGGEEGERRVGRLVIDPHKAGVTRRRASLSPGCWRRVCKRNGCKDRSDLYERCGVKSLSCGIVFD